mmetsp:Transcript_56805/g.164535  ORF Transcript_56805/g.164535 Transcript_56805/m.164535 type:complete len:309 (-) Transcript_56805:137-1063(-)
MAGPPPPVLLLAVRVPALRPGHHGRGRQHRHARPLFSGHGRRLGCVGGRGRDGRRRQAQRLGTGGEAALRQGACARARLRRRPRLAPTAKVANQLGRPVGALRTVPEGGERELRGCGGGVRGEGADHVVGAGEDESDEVVPQCLPGRRPDPPRLDARPRRPALRRGPPGVRHAGPRGQHGHRFQHGRAAPAAAAAGHDRHIPAARAPGFCYDGGRDLVASRLAPRLGACAKALPRHHRDSKLCVCGLHAGAIERLADGRPCGHRPLGRLGARRGRGQVRLGRRAPVQVLGDLSHAPRKSLALRAVSHL